MTDPAPDIPFSRIEELLSQLVAFETVSAQSNLVLIDWVEASVITVIPRRSRSLRRR